MSTRSVSTLIATLILSWIVVGHPDDLLPWGAGTAAAQTAPATMRAASAQARQASRSRSRKKRRPKAEPPAEPAATEPVAEPEPEPGADEPRPASAPAAGDSAEPGTATVAAPPSESTTPALAPDAERVDVEALRRDYLDLRDELFRSRARASTLSSQLYSTKITIRFAFTSARYYGLNRATIRLDGASVYDDTDGSVAADDAIRFEGFVAPGRHLLTFRIEATGKDDDRFTSAQEVQVALQAVAGKDLMIVAKAKDGGDIAYAWKRGEKGRYDLGIEVSVKTQKRAKPASASAAPLPRPDSKKLALGAGAIPGAIPGAGQ
jgi:hypothetical protein